MRCIRDVAVTFLFCSSLSQAALAQVTQTPPGAVRGLFGGRPAPEGQATGVFDVTIDLSGGYDDNFAPPGSGPDEFAPIQSGYTTLATTTGRYRFGTIDRYVRAAGSAGVNRVQISGDTAGASRLVRSDVTLDGATPLGRRSGVIGSFNAAYEPTFLFNVFGSPGTVVSEPTPIEPPAGSSLPIQGVDPPQPGLTSQEWFSLSGTASAFHDWTSRQRLDVGYTYWRNEPLEGSGFQSRTQSVTARHGWNFRSTGGLEFRYRYFDNGQQTEGAAQIPLTSHTAEAGFRYERRLSPTRRLFLTATGGAIQSTTRSTVDGASITFTGPTVSATARIELSTTWYIAATARRDVTVFNGITAEPFASNTTGVRMSGTIGRNLLTTVTWDYASGASGVSADGSFTTTRASAQAQYGIGRYWAFTVNYLYYDQLLQEVELTEASFPAQYSRNSIRAGVTIWLPLFGSF